MLLTVNTDVPARALATRDGFNVVGGAPDLDCETEANGGGGKGEKRRVARVSAKRLVSSIRAERSELKRVQWW